MTRAWAASAKRRGVRLGACGLAACAVLLIGAGPALAVNYVVDSTADGPDVAPGDGVCATALTTCTLRAAMQDAQALGGTNTINLLALPDPSTIDLGSALPTISGQTLTIFGAGQAALTVRRVSGGDYPIFTTNASAVTISGMTITQGRAVSQGGPVAGGGIYSFAGTLDLEDVGVVGNAAAMSGANAFAEGGGVYKEQGTLTIRDSTISQNTIDVTGIDGLAVGGGIAASLVTGFEVFNSTIGHNSVSATGPGGPAAHGGGIAVFGTTIEIVDSTVSANSAAVAGAEFAHASGGGIEAFGATFSMVTSTVDHNSATAANASTATLLLGGGLYVNGTAVVNVTSSTISANSAATTGATANDVVAGGGLGVLSGALTVSGSTLAFNAAPQGANLSDAADTARLRNTILSDPLGGGANCLEAAPNTLVSSGYNLASDASCKLTGPGDQPSTNPLLLALANNGGPTWTHALPLASPAVDRGNAAGLGTHPALTTDQRGQPRPFDQPSVANAADGADVGAFELQAVNHPPVANDDGYQVVGGATLSPAAPGVLGNDTDPDSDPLTAQLAAGPTHASSFALHADGSFTYVPDEDFVGIDTFTYRASDGQSTSNVATVTITVRAGCAGTPATVVGTQGRDNLQGTGGNDVIVGLGGNDQIDPGSGDDIVCGGSGNDTVAPGSGNDRIFGASGNDDLSGGSGDDRLEGQAGDDRLDGGSDRDTLLGGAGADKLYGGGDADSLDGGADAPDLCDGQGASDTTPGGCETIVSIP